MFAALLRIFAKRLLARASTGDLSAFLDQLTRSEPVLARILHNAIVQSYLRSARQTGRQVPSSVLVPTEHLSRPDWTTDALGDAVRFPGVEASANWLYSRRLMTAEDFAQLDSEAQAASFTVARSATIDAVQRVRDAVAESYETGGSLQDFRSAVRGSLHESMLAPDRVETLYRSHVGLAQAAGQRAVLEHPLVADEFPYLLFTATHDERTEHSHLAMETHGQNGTAVYRADDPIWNTLWPPMRFNCRCDVIPLNLEDAARHGSHEAQRWLRTGEPPATPDWASLPYPVTPPVGWPSHRGIAAVV
jgi:SPP1 gp7 family putative phage head morphogenesis protein